MVYKFLYILLILLINKMNYSMDIARNTTRYTIRSYTTENDSFIKQCKANEFVINCYFQEINFLKLNCPEGKCIIFAGRMPKYLYMPIYYAVYANPLNQNKLSSKDLRNFKNSITIKIGTAFDFKEQTIKQKEITYQKNEFYKIPIESGKYIEEGYFLFEIFPEKERKNLSVFISQSPMQDSLELESFEIQ